MLTDTHCHLFFPAYDEDPEELIRRAQEAGVTRMVQVGTTAVESKSAVEIAEKYRGMVATVGIHPQEWET